MNRKGSVIQMALITAVIYMIVLMVMENDYSTNNLLRIGVKGLVFAIVFGFAIWLLNRFRKPKGKE